MISSMRKLLPALVLVASAVSVPAFAADWVYVGSDSAAEYYVDRATIRQVRTYKQAWVQTIYFDSDALLEREVNLNEFDCAGGRLRLIQSSEYFRDGQNRSETGDRVWFYAPPTSIANALIDYACFGTLPQ